MSPYDLLDPAVTLAHSILQTLADAVPGPTGGAAVALGVVALTLLVRAALLPLAVAGVRADRARRALAPELARIRRRCGTDRERLAAETMAAYRAAGVSPLVGVGPALLQVPVVSTLYRVVVAPTVAGGPNLLVGMVVLGAPLTGLLTQRRPGCTRSGRDRNHSRRTHTPTHGDHAIAVRGSRSGASDAALPIAVIMQLASAAALHGCTRGCSKVAVITPLSTHPRLHPPLTPR